MQDLVSIVIPTYNSAFRIKECINSIINQTYENIEIIIIDGRSSDNTIDLIKEIEDKRIIYKVFNKRGMPPQRNEGIRIAKGKYICLIDSDDTIDENYIDTMVSIAKLGYRLVTPNLVYQYYINDKFSRETITLKEDLKIKINISNFYDYLFGQFCFCTPCKFYDASICKKVKFNKELSYGEDFGYVYDLIKSENDSIDVFFSSKAKYFYYNEMKNNKINRYKSNDIAKLVLFMIKIYKKEKDLSTKKKIEKLILMFYDFSIKWCNKAFGYYSIKMLQARFLLFFIIKCSLKQKLKFVLPIIYSHRI